MALGDAVCSFNPIYGQGMTCAAREAAALGAALDRHGCTGARRSRATSTRRRPESIATPWRFAVGGDFVYPRDDRAAAARHRGAQLVRPADRPASQVDAEVNRRFVSVQQLVTPPGVLTEPRFVARVLRGARARKRE